MDSGIRFREKYPTANVTLDPERFGKLREWAVRRGYADRRGPTGGALLKNIDKLLRFEPRREQLELFEERA